MATFESIKEFLKNTCPYKMHYCNGKHMPSINGINGADMKRNIPDKQQCEFFIDGKCTHTYNPKNVSEDYAQPLRKPKKEANHELL